MEAAGDFYVTCVLVDVRGVGVTSAGTPIVVEAEGRRVGRSTPKGMCDMGYVDGSNHALLVCLHTVCQSHCLTLAPSGPLTYC